MKPTAALLMLPLLALAAEPRVPAGMRQFNDDAGWCWFGDERLILHNGRVWASTVANGARDPARKGSVEVTVIDPAGGAAQVSTLHARFQADDHNNAALLPLPDGGVLAAYAKHGNEPGFWTTRTDGRLPVTWSAPRRHDPPPSAGITYNNLFRRPDGALVNFFRGYQGRIWPTRAVSPDGGATWTEPAWVLRSEGTPEFPAPGKSGHRPYAKYAQAPDGRIHMLFTDGHPRDFGNSLRHLVVDGDRLLAADGAERGRIDGSGLPVDRGTLVFAGGADRIAWIQDVHTDAAGRPVCVFSVRLDRRDDIRYRLGRWDSAAWRTREIGFAGRALYAPEVDYAGGICLDPDDTAVVYACANVNIRSGQPAGTGRYELWRGMIGDDLSVTWTALTADSTEDNLRPAVPARRAGKTALLWLRGAYRTYTSYDLRLVGVVE